jgi:hypothetical protein
MLSTPQFGMVRRSSGAVGNYKHGLFRGLTRPSFGAFSIAGLVPSAKGIGLTVAGGAAGWYFGKKKPLFAALGAAAGYAAAQFLGW